jgi:hypothetical protein
MSEKIYGIGAQFASAADLYHAAEQVRDKGFKFFDTFSPFPIHGMEKAMGHRKSWVSAFVLAGGLTGFTTAFCLQTFTSIPRPGFLKNVDSGWYLDLFYPQTVQGKPYFSLPAFVPVLFELTVLLASFGAVIGMLVCNLLPRLNHPVFNWELFSNRASDDGFFLVIEAVDPRFSETETAAFLAEIGGKDVSTIAK